MGGIRDKIWDQYRRKVFCTDLGVSRYQMVPNDINGYIIVCRTCRERYSGLLGL